MRPAGWPLGAYAALKRIAQDARDRDARPLILHYAIGEFESSAAGWTRSSRRATPSTSRARWRAPPATPAAGGGRRLQFRIGGSGSTSRRWLRSTSAALRSRRRPVAGPRRARRAASDRRCLPRGPARRPPRRRPAPTTAGRRAPPRGCRTAASTTSSSAAVARCPVRTSNPPSCATPARTLLTSSSRDSPAPTCATSERLDVDDRDPAPAQRARCSRRRCSRRARRVLVANPQRGRRAPRRRDAVTSRGTAPAAADSPRPSWRGALAALHQRPRARPRARFHCLSFVTYHRARRYATM